MADEGTEGAVNVRLRFTTREESLRLPNEAPILVPTSFKRYQLSQYINTQLALGQSVPFEFLINGTYLRTSIDEFLAENGISAETTLNVEYVRARIPPQWVANYQHDDWVSDVHTSTIAQPDQAVSRILTASYDGRLRVWNTSSQVIATSPSAGDGGHLSFVKSARYVSATQIASAGFDRTVRLWKYSEADDGSSATIAPALELYGHTGSVDSVDTHAQSHRILTASADHSVRLWSTRKTDAPQAPENLIPNAVTKEGKRRKLNPSVSVPRRGAIAAMDAHTGAVSAARFDVKDSTVAYSASQDHTVRTWDLVTSALVDTRTTSNPLFCIEQMPALNLLATGTAGRDVKLVDPRASAATVIAMSLKGHKNHVVSLARDPDNEYVLASGSHDGTCRIWDLRSTKNNKDGVTSQSIYTIARASLQGKATPPTGEGVKVFGVCWDRSIGLLTAGEDKNVQVNSSDSMS